MVEAQYRLVTEGLHVNHLRLVMGTSRRTDMARTLGRRCGSLDLAFDDIAELALRCRFRDCAHGVEEGCAVQSAILEGALDAERWQSYQKLRAEVAWHERKTDVSAALAEKRRWKKIHKEMRSHKNHW
jgi:hypothetical protein